MIGNFKRSEKDISIIIPVYNESECIVKNLTHIFEILESEVKKEAFTYEIVVVDDGSTDNSYELMRQEFSDLRIVKHEYNLGISETIRTGLQSANGKYVTYLDADLQFNPLDIVRLYRYAVERKAVFVWGQSDKSSYSLFRYLVSRGHNVLGWILFGIPTTIDINSLKVIKMSALDDFHFSKNKEAINLELFLHATKHKYYVTPFPNPIKVSERTAGTSSFRIQLVFQGIGAMVLYRFRQWF